MKIQNPAIGIMQSAEFKDTKVFQIACDCHTLDHSIHMWVEVGGDTETQDVEVTFYVNTWTPPFDNILARIKSAINILFRGVDCKEHSLILKKQAALNFAATIEKTVKELEPHSRTTY